MKGSIGRGLCLAGLVGAMTGFCPRARALTIIPTFNWSATDQYIDPDGVNRTADLIPIMEYAASYWESIILDEHTIQVDFYWKDIIHLGDTAQNAYDAADRVTDCTIRIDTGIEYPSGEWCALPLYLDPVPSDSVEYDMRPTVYHTLAPQRQLDWFDGSPPAGLEASYHGHPLAASGPEVDRTDVLSVLLHEIGHVLGVGGRLWQPETGDGDYDFNPAWIGGASAAVNCYDAVDNRIHLAPTQALMHPFIASRERRLPGTADILAEAASAGWTQLNIPRRHFLGGSDYNTPSNWILGQMPDGDDDVFVCAGGTSAVSMSDDATARSLYVAEGSWLNTGPHRLDVAETVTLASAYGDPQKLTVGAAGRVVSPHLLLRSGTVEVDGGILDVPNTLQCWDPDGKSGAIRVDGGLLRTGILALGGSGYDVTLTVAEDAGLRVNQLHDIPDALVLDGAFEFGHADSAHGSREHTVSAGQVMTVGGWFTVGYDAEATVTVSGGGRIESGQLDVGVYDVPGHVVVTGPDSRWENTADVTVGLWGAGEATVSSEGYLGCEDGYIGLETIGDGSATVSGPYSLWNCTAGMHVGFHGIGTLDIANGGNVRSTHGVISYWPDGEGEVVVGGLGATWTNHTSLYVGGRPTAPGGPGTLEVNPGGVVEVAGMLKVWGPGIVDVTGADALLIADEVNVETSAGASLTIGTGGTFRTNGLTGLGISTLLGGNLQIGHSGGSGSGSYDVLPENTLTVAKEFSVGYNAPGVLTISAGGSAYSGGTGATSYVGHESGAEGEAIVSGSWVCGGAIRVGHRGTGTLEVRPGGRVTSQDATVGHGANGKGTVHVDGASATWENAGGLQLGNNGVGTMAVTSGGKVTTAWANIGRYPDANGQAIIDGEGSDWTSTGGTFYIGHEGFGALTVMAGGSVHGDLAHVAHIPTSTAILTVQDPNSQAVFTGDFHVGHAGTGYTTVSGGGTLTTPVATLGDQPAGYGAVVVRGRESSWVNAGGLQVARYGTGELSIHSQGRVETAWVNIGRNADANGSAAVKGAGSVWTSTGTFHVGYDGAGSVTARDGGRLETTAGYIARNPGSSGEAIVEGAGSKWVNSGSLWVGGDELAAGGTGRLTVRDGAEVDIAGNLYLWAGGEAEFSGGLVRVDLLAMDDSLGGEFHWTGGTLYAQRVRGYLVNNGGTFAPGGSVGFTDVDGSYTQAATGTLQIEISGSDNTDPLAPDYDAVRITDGASLAGTLELNWLPLIGDPNSKFGGAYDVLTYTSHFAGGFDAFAGTIDESYVADINYVHPLDDGNYAVRVILHDVLPGDCDVDGDVDGDDLDVIEAGMAGFEPVCEWSSGDVSLDGAVDHIDYLLWKAHAGESTPGGGLPEPATALLLAMGGLAVIRWRR